MGNDQQGWGVLQHTLQRLAQSLRVHGGKALVEEETIGVVQQEAGDREPAAFALGALPTGFAHHRRSRAVRGRGETTDLQEARTLL